MSVFQIRVDGIPPPAQNALLYETVTVVEGKPILRDMVFSPYHQYIYLLSDRQRDFRQRRRLIQAQI
ncbi:Plexin A3 [Characodon lateralis]|uniref:Plexin A3 n=1 Tax=Characodon lateralis TaxID=208331 RepID=A0ABU7EXM7_9TELE|nr:Plexin A3 [Characodon lateralis]